MTDVPQIPLAMRAKSAACEKDRALAALAARQWGVVSRRQLLRLGLSNAAIERRVRSARLQRLHRGVYAVGHAALRREGRLAAALLAAGPGAALACRSAALWWDLRTTAPQRIEVSVVSRGQRRVDGVIVHCVRRLDDVTVHNGLPVTTVARTLLDVAAVSGRAALERALERAEILRLLDVKAIDDVLARHPRRAGARALRAAVSRYSGPSWTRSELERRFLALAAEIGLPPPRVNTIAAGYEVDFLWSAQRLVVETDGFAHHASRGAQERDRRRDLDLRLAGYDVVRVTWRQLREQPRLVASAVLRAHSRPLRR